MKMNTDNPLRSFVASSAALIGYQFTVYLPYVMCAVFVGKLGDSLSLAAYGLSTTVMSMGF